MSDVYAPLRYDMKPNPGDCLIFYHEKFEDEEPRKGAGSEVEMLQSILQNFKFERFFVYKDPLEDKIETVLDEWVAKDHKNDSAVVVAVLTHGDEDTLSTYNTEYKPRQIWDKVAECEDLKGKPKIFIFQACRGDVIDSGKGEVDGKKRQVDKYQDLYPTEPDMLVIYSSTLYNPSMRGWMVQSINEAQAGNKCHGIDIMRVLTGANNIMNQKEDTVPGNESENGQTPEKKIKQCLEVYSTLRKELYLTP
ncbi:caspase-8-like [Ischnura elegans]|uniref:caspase-8-like n=1 Tax=Ischnura elegans TaxID=197161 RepID=UPI001ED893FB|nr:caspase-8-like [Ischnura elegans]